MQNQKKPHNPTPYLGKPNSRRQQFTYSENQLLDQITMEVMEAFKKDLHNANKYYKTVTTIAEKLIDTYERVEDKFPELENFLNSDSFKTLYEQFNERNQEINLRLQELNSKVLDIHQKIKDDSVRVFFEKQSLKSNETKAAEKPKEQKENKKPLFETLTTFFNMFGK